MKFYRSILLLSLSLFAVTFVRCSRIPIRTVVASPKFESTPQHTEIPVYVPSATISSTVAVTKSLLEPETADNLVMAVEITDSNATDFVWVVDTPDTQSGVAMTGTDLVMMFTLPQGESGEIPDDNPTLITSAKQNSVTAWKNADEVVRVWDVQASEEMLIIPGNGDPITSLALSSDGNMIAVATVEKSADIWNIENKEIIQTLQSETWLSNLEFSPDNSRLAGVDTANFTVMIFDVGSGQYLSSLVWTDTASPALYGAYFSPDWKQLAWFARGTVQIMNTETGVLKSLLSHEDFVNSVAWSPNSSLIATAAAGTVNGTFTPVVYIWNTVNGEKVSTIPIDIPVTNISFSPDGRELAILKSDGTFQIWVVE